MVSVAIAARNSNSTSKDSRITVRPNSHSLRSLSSNVMLGLECDAIDLQVVEFWMADSGFLTSIRKEKRTTGKQNSGFINLM
ncbi:unnamed protein product [Sphenostylis stenocarpa]|uniref:Uncharacterized protein n=1 Tax=Sphenostylis stenocarpa TaxID=92480 RepID=A0AA86VLZ1_9FABA|nr:unnamed protein product [Sphenostylis stenocarpa]